MTATEIVHIDDPFDAAFLQDLRALFLEYEEAIGVKLDFQDFEVELAGLPGYYAPPEGAVFFARVDGKLAGCVAMKKFGPGTCEMKRLFVRPGFRGLSLGRILAERLMEHAKTLGYARMRLDSLPTMKAAQTLYWALGFKEISPYYDNPIDGTLFMEADL